MLDKRQMIPVGGLFGVFIVAGYMVVQLAAQGAARDLTSAALAEVRDVDGRTVLSGRFAQIDEDDDDTERKATLVATDTAAAARGEVEVEFAPGAASAQEVEFSIEGMTPGAAYTFVIDGEEVARATSDRQGRAEIEIDVPRASAGR
jgi:hypothetical protein